MAEKTIGIFGFGRTGKALLDYVIRRALYKRIILINDFLINEKEAQTQYEAQGVEFLVVKEDLAALPPVDLLVLSPGVDGRKKRFEILRKRGVRIISEIEFATRNMKNKMIAVTGTNGKSTTVSLIHHILKQNGIPSVLAGNIGDPLIGELEGIDENAVVVLEVSSFQLEEIETFSPHIALLLNITPDHLDRYSGMSEYMNAKLNIFKNQKEGDFRILNGDDPQLESVGKQTSQAATLWFSRTQKVTPGAHLNSDRILFTIDDKEIQISLADNPLKGVHNLENILAASLAVTLMGISPSGITSALSSFEGLAHRMELVGFRGKVEFINDSKATNPDATLKSVLGINKKMVLILGGKDKGGDFTQLVPVIKQKVDQVFLMGHAAQNIYQQLEGVQDRCVFVKDLNDAVFKGYDALKFNGGVVLLAPGCASFDMFDDFEHRGQVFTREVQHIVQLDEEILIHG